MRRFITILSILSVFIAAFYAAIQEHKNPAHTKGNDTEEATGALQSLDFWTRARAYPFGDIPADKYYKAYQAEMSKRINKVNTLNTSTTWAPIGPTNLQGRSLSVAINPLNPNTVYLGSASGGLWRSRNGALGGDWQRVSLGYPALGISAIAIDPTDTNIIFLGTGEVYQYQTATGGLVVRTTRGSYGLGILKTTNSGATWSKSLDWTYNQERGIEALKMNPLNPHTLWAATTEGIYKSVDAGTSWNLMLPVLMGEDLVIKTNDTNKIIASCGNFSTSGAGIHRTTNGGISWTQLGGIPAFSGKTMLDMYAANPDVVYASSADSTTGVGRLLRTTNFGDSWSTMSDNTTNDIFTVQGWYSHYVVVHPTDINLIVHNSVNRSKSTDGGITFSGVGSGYSDNHGFAHHPTNPNILYAVNDNGIYRSTNFGSTYTNVGSGMQTGQFYNGFSNSASNPDLAIGQSQDHIPGYRYTGSMIWDHSTVVDEAGWTGINQLNDNIMYAVDRFGGNMYKSADGGASFSFVSSFGGTGSWNSPFVLSPSNPNVLYFGDSRIHKSTDAGINWSMVNGGNPLDGNPALSMAISRSNPDTAFVGLAPIATNAHVFSTVNGGVSWTDVSGSLPDRYPMDLAVDPANSRTVYAAFGGFGTGHLFKSTDTGTNWTDITGTLPDVPTTAIAIDPINPTDVYTGNDIGVYVSSDGGATWSSFSEGLPDAVITADLSVSPSNRMLRIATHGNGVYQRELLHQYTASLFDYRALSFDSPVNYYHMSSESTITTIRASFSNLGGQLSSDSFFVAYRILKGASEVYSNIRKISPLALGETRQVTFGGIFAPPDSGIYNLQAIVIASDQNSANDTIKGTLTVIKAGSITKPLISKFHRPYAEITNGTVISFFDLDVAAVVLPFPMLFDGFQYDSIQISSYGWADFGKTGYGYYTERGLAIPFDPFEEFSFNDILFSNEQLKKTIAPWWDGLAIDNAGDPNAAVSYAVQGSSPNRVFVIQWKSMLASYAGSTTTRINFQVRLYETTNTIEFHYGPVQAGTYDGDGASIGMNDYIGGSFHYFDIAAGRTGYIDQGTTNLNPLTN